MDVLVLIDKLDDLVHNAKTVPMTGTVRVDQEEIYDILDQMRATIPEEIKQARWIVKERQEMLAEAKREAERIVKEARERQTAARLPAGGHQAGRAPGRGHRRGRPRPRARDPARRGGLRRRDPQHARGQPLEVHRRGPARPRAAAGQGRAGRSRLSRLKLHSLARSMPVGCGRPLHFCCFAVALTGCGGPGDAVAAKPDVDGCAGSWLRPVPANEAQVRAATLCLLNAQRARNGVAPADRRTCMLQRAAELHSLDMARAQVLRAPRPRRRAARRADRAPGLPADPRRREPRLGRARPEHAGQHRLAVDEEPRPPRQRARARLPRDRHRPRLRGARAQDKPRQAAIYTTTFGAGGR